MTSVNKKEIDKFSKMADEWWDPEGKFKPLHKFNPTRIKYLKENIVYNFKLKNKSKPLSGIKILDIGCGGGLLSEPMSRMGANVTGIDASDKNIKIAKIHSKKNKLKINYLCSSPEKLKISKKFDVIICMYHDQATIPIKTLDFENGVNVTLGLPIVRTSPDHGTALDIAGKGIASEKSLYASIKISQNIAKKRKLWIQ